MDYHSYLYLAILGLGFILFSREIFPLEISALTILLLLVLSGIVDHQEAFSQFGHNSVVMIAALFILTAGLRRTGIIRKIEDFFILLGGKSKSLSFVVLMLLVALVSAFVSNTATLAVVIPIAVAMARSHGESPKTWLLPLAFVSVLGGMNSLIGTSTNIIISGLLPAYGLEQFNMFTTFSVAFPLLAFGFLYLILARKGLLGGNSKVAETSIDVKYDIKNFTAEVVVHPDSPLCNTSLENSKLFREVDILVLGVSRADEPLLFPRAGFVVRQDDTLLVEGNIARLTEIIDKYGLAFAEQAQNDNQNGREKPSGGLSADVELHEVVITASSMLSNRTAAETFLRSRYRISLIAISRHGVTLHEQLSKVRFQSGDILVVQFLGYIDNTILDFLGLVPMQSLKTERYYFEKAPLAASIFIGSLMLGSLTSIPLSVSCLAGGVLLVMSKILRINEVYESIRWKVLIFIGAILALGQGMENSGTAAFLGSELSSFFLGMDTTYTLSFFIITTVVMTSLLSNQATAVIMIPIALSTSHTLGLDPMPFIMAVTIGSSCCFVTPFEPAFMMVYGPGEYKFADFFRFGIFLNLTCIALAILLIPYFWSF